MTEAALAEDAPISAESLHASGQAAIKAVLFVKELFEDLWENDVTDVTEEQLRALAVDCGVVFERELDADEIAKRQAIDPSFQAEPGDVIPELSDDLMTFIDTMEAAVAEQPE
jgi:hypothetical protein